MTRFGRFRFLSDETLQKIEQKKADDFTPEELMKIELEMQRQDPKRNFDQLMREIQAVDDRLKRRMEQLQASQGFALGIIAVLMIVEALLVFNALAQHFGLMLK